MSLEIKVGLEFSMPIGHSHILIHNRYAFNNEVWNFITFTLEFILLMHVTKLFFAAAKYLQV